MWQQLYHDARQLLTPKQQTDKNTEEIKERRTLNLMSIIANLIEVRALPDYKLWLRYDDGVVGDIDLSHLVVKGVFKLWDDYRNFEQVTLGPHGELTWGDDVDMCADALYLDLTGKRPEEVFANLTEHVDA